MQEAFLHYVWKYKILNSSNIQTVQGEALQILSCGEHNQNAGPDFFNAQLVLDGQRWAGNIEIHVKASDWYVHNHEQDQAYKNVILHVVWEYDTEVYREDNSVLPTLVLKDYVEKQTLDNYYKLNDKDGKWIFCENHFAEVSNFTLYNWLERLFTERLERKTKEIEALLTASKNNWEAVLFVLLAKNFGLKVNGEAFRSIAQHIPWQVMQKIMANNTQLEAVFFGQAGLLHDEIQEPYFLKLKKEYAYLTHKFGLQTKGVLPCNFFRLRPSNFPTIRLAQLAALYHTHTKLFAKLISVKSPQEAYPIFKNSVSAFWQDHYTFKSKSKKSPKALTKKFIDLLLVNTIIPIQYCYAKHQGKTTGEQLITFAAGISPEQNSIVAKFNELKPITSSALHSQALIQLKTRYCDEKKCLECAIGNTLLSRK